VSAYLIDTDMSIDFLGRRAYIVDLIDRLLPTGIAISVVTYMEWRCTREPCAGAVPNTRRQPSGSFSSMFRRFP